MTRRRRAALAVALVLVGLAPLVAQELTCPPYAPREKIAACLARVFDETPLWRGLDHRGNLLEIFANGGVSWSVVITLPSGGARIMSAGDFNFVLPQLPGRPG